MRALVAILCLAFALTGRASSSSSEISDLWYTVGEDGWGVNIVLQNDVAFATFYVYDTNRNPVWFTAVLGFSGAPGYVMAGDLFVDRGPWFGGAFNPATVTERKAGTATFTLNDLSHATLTYTVDGVVVSKQLERLTFKLEDFSGAYGGGYSIRKSSCTPSSLNGLQDVSGYLTLTQTGSNLKIAVAASDGTTCTFNGTLTQYGKMAQTDGTYACSDTTVGTFQLLEMTPTTSGFTARATGRNQFCQWSGQMGGITLEP
ncbi:MAG: hypothetical protein ABI607_06720 [Betaproteobacteria bacterium]